MDTVVQKTLIDLFVSGLWLGGVTLDAFGAALVNRTKLRHIEGNH